MRKYHRTSTHSHDEHSAIVRLACAVILLSVEDYRDPKICDNKDKPRIHESARQFLISDDLNAWCAITQIDANAVRRGLKLPKR